MALAWIHENPATWDEGKQRIVGRAPKGVFEHLTDRKAGELVPGDWWRVEKDGHTVGYGWMDVVWGDGEVLLAVDPEARREGVGAFVVEHLVREARAQGLRSIYNTVRPTHPEREAVSRWLRAQGFEAAGEDGEVLRRSA